MKKVISRFFFRVSRYSIEKEIPIKKKTVDTFFTQYLHSTFEAVSNQKKYFFFISENPSGREVKITREQGWLLPVFNNCSAPEARRSPLAITNGL